MNLLWFAGWITNRLPIRLAMQMPEPVLRSAYRQLYRELLES